MLLRTKGVAKNISKNLVGKVTRFVDKLDEKSFYLVEEEIAEIPSSLFLGVISTKPQVQFFQSAPSVLNVPSLSHLNEGDIVGVGIDGNVKTIYRVNSYHNSLLATELDIPEHVDPLNGV